MHEKVGKEQVLSDNFEEDEEEKRRRLYSWLVLCDDSKILPAHIIRSTDIIDYL